MPPQNSIVFLGLNIRTSTDCFVLCILSTLCLFVGYNVCHFLTFLFTGYYLDIEIKHAPDRWYQPCAYLLWLLGADPSEL